MNLHGRVSVKVPSGGLLRKYVIRLGCTLSYLSMVVFLKLFNISYLLERTMFTIVNKECDVTVELLVPQRQTPSIGLPVQYEFFSLIAERCVCLMSGSLANAGDFICKRERGRKCQTTSHRVVLHSFLGLQ